MHSIPVSIDVPGKKAAGEVVLISYLKIWLLSLALFLYSVPKIILASQDCAWIRLPCECLRESVGRETVLI